jgi:Uma2 family endonuclease
MKSADPVPLPLHSGDRMKQPEFHRRYQTHPEHVKFELVGGTVFMASPARWLHGEYEEEVGYVLGTYRRATPGVAAAHNATAILGEESEPQPDMAVRILTECGGQSRINADEYLEGAPEFLTEIAYSSYSLDLNGKRQDYQQAGVLEYLVVCIEPNEIHWFHFPSDRELKPNRMGLLCSKVLPGLWIDAPALLARDSQRLMSALQKGLASRQHAAFVKRLEAARRRHG